MISTLDTMVFILGLSFSHDIQVRQMGATVTRRVLSTRIAIFAALVLGSIVSILFSNLLQTGLALSSLGLVLAPSLMLLLLWGKPNSVSVEWGLVGGLATCILLLFSGRLTPESSILAFVVACVATGVGAAKARLTART